MDFVLNLSAPAENRRSISRMSVSKYGFNSQIGTQQDPIEIQETISDIQITDREFKNTDLENATQKMKIMLDPDTFAKNGNQGYKEISISSEATTNDSANAKNESSENEKNEIMCCCSPFKLSTEHSGNAIKIIQNSEFSFNEIEPSDFAEKDELSIFSFLDDLQINQVNVKESISRIHSRKSDNLVSLFNKQRPQANSLISRRKNLQVGFKNNQPKTQNQLTLRLEKLQISTQIQSNDNLEDLIDCESEGHIMNTNFEKMVINRPSFSLQKLRI